MNTMNAVAQPALATITSPMTTPELASTSADPRLCHLFRATLKNGRIHPLYLPMLKYRQQTHAAGVAA